MLKKVIKHPTPFSQRYHFPLANKHYTPWEDHIILQTPTCSSPECRFILMETAKWAAQSDGVCAEFGVYRGKSASLIAEAVKEFNKEIYLFDTFSGIPDVSDQDIYWENGDFSDTSVASVQEYLRNWKNIKIIQGQFNNTINILQDKNLCFAHIDSDTYSSVKTVLEFILPKMALGSAILLDDYGDLVSKGAKKATDEILGSQIIYLTTKQCLYIHRYTT